MEDKQDNLEVEIMLVVNGPLARVVNWLNQRRLALFDVHCISSHPEGFQVVPSKQGKRFIIDMDYLAKKLEQSRSNQDQS